MENDLHRQLEVAYNDKKLNKAAYDEINKWVREDEFTEFRPDLEKKILAGDWSDLMDEFYRVVIFGTGGIRGIMDLGTNRINNYTIRWASQAYANYLHKFKSDLVDKGVAIAYDSRLHSDEFMKETARVLAANGVHVHIFRYYRATPELSFTVRHLGLVGVLSSRPAITRRNLTDTSSITNMAYRFYQRLDSRLKVSSSR